MNTKELLRTLATNVHLLLVSLVLAGMTFATITDPATSQARSSPDKHGQKLHSSVIDFSVSPPKSPGDISHHTTQYSSKSPPPPAPVSTRPTRHCKLCTPIVPTHLHRHFCPVYCTH